MNCETFVVRAYISERFVWSCALLFRFHILFTVGFSVLPPVNIAAFYEHLDSVAQILPSEKWYVIGKNY